MSSVSKRKKEGLRGKMKTMGDHKEFLKRITKTLYYGQLPTLPCLSLPVTEISCEVWSEVQRGRSLRRLRADAAAATARAACVSPCALVLALLYVERLQRCNPHYLAAADPDQLFLVSLMVSNKFLQDDGEDDEVICSEWATSGGLTLAQLKKLELDFLNAIEWKVYVSARSFEAGLAWLERRVALRQAGARGYFTYGDLAACRAPPALALARALAAAALAYLAALAALLASALLVAQVLRSLPAHSVAPADLSHSVRSTDLAADAPAPATNATVDPDVRLPVAGLTDELADERLCCGGWRRHLDGARAHSREARRGADAAAAALADWLYRSSLVNPLQRWLDVVLRYSDLFRSNDSARAGAGCGTVGGCGRGWVSAGRLSLHAVSVSDR